MGLLSKLFSRTQKKEESANVLGKYYTLEDLTPEFCGNSGIIYLLWEVHKQQMSNTHLY